METASMQMKVFFDEPLTRVCLREEDGGRSAVGSAVIEEVEPATSLGADPEV